MTTSNRMREAREHLQMRQAFLASALGVSPQQISKFEMGHRVPTTAQAEILARELKMTVEELFPGMQLRPDENISEYFDVNIEFTTGKGHDFTLSKHDAAALRQQLADNRSVGFIEARHGDFTYLINLDQIMTAAFTLTYTPPRPAGNDEIAIMLVNGEIDEMTISAESREMVTALAKFYRFTQAGAPQSRLVLDQPNGELQLFNLSTVGVIRLPRWVYQPNDQS